MLNEFDCMCRVGGWEEGREGREGREEDDGLHFIFILLFLFLFLFLLPSVGVWGVSGWE